MAGLITTNDHEKKNTIIVTETYNPNVSNPCMVKNTAVSVQSGNFNEIEIEDRSFK